MRFTRKTMIAGAAALSLAGAAYAADQHANVMKVQLPDGSIEEIHYTGDVAPRVVFAPVAAVDPASMLEAAFGADSVFAQMERMQAQMMAQHQAMMQQAATMAAQAPAADTNRLHMTSIGDAPAGASYTYISTTTTQNGCTQTIEISSKAGDKASQVHKTSAGDCTAAKAGATPAIETAPAARPAPAVKPVSAPAPVKTVPANTI
ncbi:hypothetical protein [Sphingomonas montanisoli]|uniref:Uncharacterized protein n=1 Tax=Sphingomonas montanisoli TaxID=2606412 RepID=A0A5D9C8L0_9SPHN|nr:hypothetical protein [Sphingomonas montanisoli]TZG27676.1 hypothetical protein FYJ91_08875 [Sphingomonas montanisoli]